MPRGNDTQDDKNDVSIGEILDRLGRQEESVKRIELSLYFGNGDSITSKVAVLGTQIGDMSDMMEERLGDIAEALKPIPEIQKSVVLHHHTPHMWDSIKAPGFWFKVSAGIFVAFMVLHTVASYLPDMWNGIMLAFGLPHLVIRKP